MEDSMRTFCMILSSVTTSLAVENIWWLFEHLPPLARDITPYFAVLVRAKLAVNGRKAITINSRDDFIFHQDFWLAMFHHSGQQQAPGFHGKLRVKVVATLAADTASVLPATILFATEKIEPFLRHSWQYDDVRKLINEIDSGFEHSSFTAQSPIFVFSLSEVRATG